MLQCGGRLESDQSNMCGAVGKRVGQRAVKIDLWYLWSLCPPLLSLSLSIIAATLVFTFSNTIWLIFLHFFNTTHFILFLSREEASRINELIRFSLNYNNKTGIFNLNPSYYNLSWINIRISRIYEWFQSKYFVISKLFV